jgi:hypothetical protein
MDFEHIMRSVLPSVFRFSASDVYFSHATPFYAAVATTAPPALAVAVLDPFFTGAPTGRFLEVALDHFFKVLLFECSLAPPALVAHLAAFCAECFARAARLPPGAHRLVLCALHDPRLPAFRELAIARFLWPATLARLRTSACPRGGRYRMSHRTMGISIREPSHGP